MTRRASALSMAVFAAYLAVQLLHTIKDRNTWPFCSYNMFNEAFPPEFESFRVRLRDDTGWGQPMKASGLMPLEFFRITEILDHLFYSGRDAVDDQTRGRFCAIVLDRLNTTPWRRGDEIAASLRPRAGQFTGLEVLVVEIAVDGYDPATDRPWLNHTVLAHYEEARPCGID